MLNLEKLSAAELVQFQASMLGVGIVGMGLGLMLSKFLASYAFLIMVLGLLMHSWGMYKMHQNDKKKISLMRILYWVCWVILIGLAIYTVIGIFR